MANHFHLAALKVLGLCNYLFTTPLWQVSEDKSVPATEMPRISLQLTTFLKDMALNPKTFMEGQVYVFGENSEVDPDPVFSRLLKPDVFDDECLKIIPVVMAALTKCTEHVLRDFLPGGKHAEGTI